ncbi:O-acyltransferase like protein-like [Aricia agestis]|uniref:O-acyltransferase like protein-like n=1 Tax=Aricia agestis TaxID=91739 RepID=UPI001C20B43A|nr:O-acyltransferase like protein-like [Aricia agestis]
MGFWYSIVFLSVLYNLIPHSHCKGYARADATDTFDTDLIENTLDPELCQRQLDYLRNEDTLLRLQLLESGIRLPRGITKGNFMDFGNFRQCLAIHKEVEDMTIQGKFCMMSVPVNIELQIQNDFTNLAFDAAKLNKNIEFTDLIKQINKEREFVLERERMNIFRNGVNRNEDSEISFRVAVCLPSACTLKDALSNPLFNISDVGLNVKQEFCRLPNDKPFVAADYVAWVIFSLLGLITTLSTIYDVRHTFIFKKDPKEANEILNAFSLYKNSCQIIKINASRPGTLDCLDGIRALSIIWVIIGHTFMMASYYPANPIDMYNWYTSLGAIWMKTSTLAVDTFFMLSGLLVVYTTTKKFTAKQLAKNLHLFYLHRLLRLFPVLAAVILFKTSIYHHLGDGAVWEMPARDVQSCRSYWWVTLLYLQNFLIPQGGCVGEAWYLSIDVHLHILSPIVLLWVLSGAKRPAWVALISTLLLSLVGATTYVFVNGIMLDSPDHYAYYYVNILTRTPPFLIGMIYGYLLHLRRENKVAIRKRYGYLTTVMSLCLLALILYSDHIHTHGDVTDNLDQFFLTFKRSAWVVTVGWIIFACVNGFAGPINWFLSMSLWKIPSRISYSMYLSHLTLMLAYYGSILQPTYFSVELFMFDFFGFLYLTIFVAFFMTAIIDSPFAILSRVLLVGGAKKQNKKVREPESSSAPGITQEKTVHEKL